MKKEKHDSIFELLKNLPNTYEQEKNNFYIQKWNPEKVELEYSKIKRELERKEEGGVKFLEGMLEAMTTGFKGGYYTFGPETLKQFRDFLKLKMKNQSLETTKSLTVEITNLEQESNDKIEGMKTAKFFDNLDEVIVVGNK